MPELPTNPDAPAPETPSSRATPSGINRADAASLSKTEGIASVALQPAYLQPITESDGEPDPADPRWNITEANIRALLADVTLCRDHLSNAAGKTEDKKVLTGAEEDHEEALVRDIQFFQARARQRFARTQPEKLRSYHIGDRLRGNRSNLEQYANDVLTRAEADQLPGVTPARLLTFTERIAKWKTTDQTQGGTQGEAMRLRAEAKRLLETILDRRLTLQFAADALWPYWDEANLATRREFQLPASRPFDG